MNTSKVLCQINPSPSACSIRPLMDRKLYLRPGWRENLPTIMDSTQSIEEFIHPEFTGLGVCLPLPRFLISSFDWHAICSASRLRFISSSPGNSAMWTPSSTTSIIRRLLITPTSPTSCTLGKLTSIPWPFYSKALLSSPALSLFISRNFNGDLSIVDSFI